MSLTPLIPLLAWCAFVGLLLWCLMAELRRGDPETDAAATHAEEYWLAEVDRWLAQLAEIRSLATLPDRDVASSIASAPLRGGAPQSRHPTQTPSSRMRNDHHRASRRVEQQPSGPVARRSHRPSPARADDEQIDGF